MIPPKDKGTILLTRDPEKNQITADLFREAGYTVVSWPTFAYDEVQAPLPELTGFDWLVFFSNQAVKVFFDRAVSIPEDIKIAAVGDQTAKLIAEKGQHVELIPSIKTSRGLASEKMFQNSEGFKIYCPVTEDATMDFFSLLKKKHEITWQVIYRKKPLQYEKKEIEFLMKQHIDWVLFYSPSAVRFFLKQIPDVFLKTKKVAAIGPSTETYLRNFGFDVQAVAEDPSTESLIKSLLPIRSW